MLSRSKRPAGYKNGVGASLAPPASGCAQADDAKASKPSGPPRREKTRGGARPHVGKHTAAGKRLAAKVIAWISTSFITREARQFPRQLKQAVPLP